MRGAIILKGLALGLGAAVPIGPVNVEIARRVLRNGFRNGFALGCGAVSIDVSYAVLSSLGLRPVLNRPALLWPLTIGGIGLLAGLGFLSPHAHAPRVRSKPIRCARAAAGGKRARALT